MTCDAPDTAKVQQTVLRDREPARYYRILNKKGETRARTMTPMMWKDLAASDQPVAVKTLSVWDSVEHRA